MKERLVSIGFVAASVIFLGLTFYLLVEQAPYDRTGIALITAVLCALFGHFDQIASFKATLTSVEAKMREVNEVVGEAKATLESLHKIAAMAGAMLINLNTGSGRWDTLTEMKDARREKIIQALESVDLDKSELAEVAIADKEWVVIDYCQGIFKGWASGRTLAPDEQITWDEFAKPWKGVGVRWPSPDECLVCMDKLNITDAVARDLLEDYRYYMEHGEHRRPEVWRNRDEWLRRSGLGA